MGTVRNNVDVKKFNPDAVLPFELRPQDFQMAMQDVYDVDTETEPATNRRPMTFTEVYLGHVMTEDFRRNPRGELGTRTATLHKHGIKKFRKNWIYRHAGSPLG